MAKRIRASVTCAHFIVTLELARISYGIGRRSGLRVRSPATPSVQSVASLPKGKITTPSENGGLRRPVEDPTWPGCAVPRRSRLATFGARPPSATVKGSGSRRCLFELGNVKKLRCNRQGTELPKGGCVFGVYTCRRQAAPYSGPARIRLKSILAVWYVWLGALQ